MIRSPFLVRAAVVTAVLCSGSLDAPAARDALSSASGRRIADLRAALRGDLALYASAVKTTLADQRAGRASAAEAWDTHTSALTFLIRKADAAAASAAAGFLDDAVAAIRDAGDATAPGTLAGAGGSIDEFVADVRAELARTRATVTTKSRSFGRSFVRTGRGVAATATSFPDWAFDLRGAPTSDGVVTVGESALRLRMVTAARLPDGRVVVAACGTADAALDGAFDLRLRGASSIDVIPPALSAGGVAVSAAGTWSVSSELGDPFEGGVPVAGNRVLQFGVDPFDGGPAGRQPGRILLATVFGIP